MAKDHQSNKISPSGLGTTYSGELNISFENFLKNIHCYAIYNLTTMI